MTGMAAPTMSAQVAFILTLGLSIPMRAIVPRTLTAMKKPTSDGAPQQKSPRMLHSRAFVALRSNSATIRAIGDPVGVGWGGLGGLPG